jgi:hypothetical protein
MCGRHYAHDRGANTLDTRARLVPSFSLSSGWYCGGPGIIKDSIYGLLIDESA